MNDFTDQYSPKDIQKNKGIAILSYLSILVLVPLFGGKSSPFARFHSNQGLVLLCAQVILYLLHTGLNFLFGKFGLLSLQISLNFLFTVLCILCLTFLVMGIMNASGGKAKELPLLGKIRLIR